MATRTATQTVVWHPDDLAVWPDGFWATLWEFWNGECSHKSDDFEVVRLEDQARLQELGIADEF
jgi:hypothetical protein